MISVNKVSKYFGDQKIFNSISFTINQNEKIGLVGRNGSGKSTLFKMVLKEIETDSGEIKIPKNYRISTVEQHIQFTKRTLLEECIQALSDDEKYDHYKAEKILSGLGFENEDFNKAPSVFSGGYQIRISLVKALLANPNLLLLDEPTNYLDIVSIRWLSDFLRAFQGEIILITHDRYFMDSIITHTLGIKYQTIRKIRGSTIKYYEQIAMDEDVYEQTRLNQEKKKKYLEHFITRFKAKASKATQAQSKIKQLKRIGELDKLVSEQDMALHFQFESCPGKILLQAKNIAFSYPNNLEYPVFKNLSFNIFNQDRIGIIGKNGRGKSTLLNVLAEELQTLQGKISKHPLLKIGHFGQTNIQRLHLQNTIIDEIQNSNPELSQGKVRQICGSMMFSSDVAKKKIKILSGGERSRVLLGKILAHPTNLLFLDEPTNHLDMESVEILSHELLSYEGAVVIVTHNEWLLKSLVDKLIIFQQDKVLYFEGTYDEFLEKIGWQDETDTKKNKPKNRKKLKQQRHQIIEEHAKKTKPLKQQIKLLEHAISQIEKELILKNQKLIQATQKVNNGAEITQLSIEIDQMNKKIDTLFQKLEKPMQELDLLEQEHKKMSLL